MVINKILALNHNNSSQGNDKFVSQKISQLRLQIIQSQDHSSVEIRNAEKYLMAVARQIENNSVPECLGNVEDAARAVALIKSSEVTMFLINNLRSSDVRRRRWASCSLSSIAPTTNKTNEAIKPMIKLLDDKHPQIRADAALFLTKNHINFDKINKQYIYGKVVSMLEKEQIPTVIEQLLPLLMVSSSEANMNSSITAVSSYISNENEAINRGVVAALTVSSRELATIILVSMLSDRYCMDKIMVLNAIRHQGKYSVLAKETIENELNFARNNNMIFYQNELQSTLEYINKQ